LDSKKKADVHHLVLVNNKTGKVASTNHWLLALAARAHLSGDTSGIAGLLPQEQAKKILVNNMLTTKVERKAKAGRLTENVSYQAVKLLPQLAVLFVEQHPLNKTITRKNFCSWIVKQLADESSFATHIALGHGFEDLISRTTESENRSGEKMKPRAARWWQDRLKKLQS
jgi:hypothetical protein